MTHRENIERRIRAFLRGRRPPMGVDEQGRETLVTEFVDVLKDHVPDGGDFDAYMGELLERVMVTQPGFSWPSHDVWQKAVGGTNKARKASESPAAVQSAAYDHFVSCINGALPVSEASLFGKYAERALRENRVSYDTLRSYQRVAFFTRRQTYGVDAAFEWIEARNPTLAADLRREQKNAKEARAVRAQHAADFDGGEAEGV